MSVTNANPRDAIDEQRQRAVAMVNAGKTLREAAAAVGVSHESVRDWVNAAELREIFASSPPVAHRNKQPKSREPRKPIFVNGVRLGRLALWT